MHRKQQAYRRGFTLAELLVAITVGLIVVASLLSLVVMMNSYLMKRTATSKLSSELYHIKTEISDWFYSYDTEEYELIPVGNGTEQTSLSFQRSEEGATASVSLRFDKEERKLTGDNVSGRETEYSLVREVFFDFDMSVPCLVRCTVIYGTEGETGTYTFLLVKRTVALPESSVSG